MAKPIKETPFLYGEDARNFVNENANVEKVSEEVKKEINKSYESLKSIAKFKI
ncbi:hypothetical protein [Muricauda sp. MAR_2010_75]|uniref:hypothetical protein n=1 Tax=Allomuricauda sp. MAR_2010_75 TaxID=1250232 RepID=UPI0018CEA7A5|nr:hypothetical protein [Muricauda sp. MAR_2010_75]